MSVTRRCLNTAMAEYCHDLSSVRAGVGKPGRRGVSQIVKMEVLKTCKTTSRAKPVLKVSSWILRLVIEKDVIGVTALTVQTK